MSVTIHHVDTSHVGAVEQGTAVVLTLDQGVTITFPDTASAQDYVLALAEAIDHITNARTPWEVAA